MLAPTKQALQATRGRQGGAGRGRRWSDRRLQQVRVVQGQARQPRPGPHLGRGRDRGGRLWRRRWGHTPHHVVPLSLPATSRQPPWWLRRLLLELAVGAAELLTPKQPRPLQASQLLQVSVGAGQGLAMQCWV